MTFLRFVARSMLASYFVASGVKSLRDPGALVPVAEPLIDRVVPTLKQYAPEQVSGYIPEDPVTLIRINGVLQLVGGLALATGKGRRLGALVLAATIIPATIAKHPFWTRATEEERSADRSHFLKNVSLLGGVLLASRDTEGRPSIAYRAQKGGQAIARDTRKTTQAIARDTKKTTQKFADQGQDLVEGALAGGAALAATVVATSRKAKKKAAKELKAAQAAAAKQLEESKKAAAAAAKQAQKDAVQLQKDTAKAAEKQLAEAKKAAKKTGDKISKNINLGEN